MSAPDERSGLHPLAARGFTRGAERYERGRPAYPSDAITALLSSIGLDHGTDRGGAVLLDLGAGTGKLTRMLVPSGARVIALEPVRAMRSRLSDELPSVTALSGAAEAIPLPAGSVDAVTAGQAFHWFDARAALAEIHRVLKPNGHLALLWNTRDTSVDWVRRLSDLLAPHRGDAPGYQSLAWQRAFGEASGFRAVAARYFPHRQVFEDIEGFVDRIASVSFIAALPDGPRAEVLRSVRDLAETHPDLGGRWPVEMPYLTSLYLYERVG